ncbi:sodium:proton symporter [Burkholderia pseudomallei]|uniref:sodium:proton symporter n=1 Tax=Burkholderia pseudomallei TaxID=28450 RepID=UPI000C26FDA8|nr:sodium:proton symporter [Burkholderia pseudomallei]PJO61349.1 sodium:proton symporter [Burkholderia pseudomallei]
MTVWIDSELYFYTVSREIQALLEVRRYRRDSAAIRLRRSDASDAIVVGRGLFTTFEY